MATLLTVTATEDSTYVVNVSFTDEDGNAVVPNDVAWSLKDKSGSIINDRSDVSETPASSIDIVLSGDDLEPAGVERAFLVLTVTADYDSALGSGLPLIGQAKIEVLGLEPHV